MYRTYDIMNQKKWRRIVCIGAGYVGTLTSAAVAFNCKNHQVTVVDKDYEKIDAWTSESLPVYEPQFKQMLHRVQDANLHFSTDMISCLSNADIVFICVNTPNKKTGEGKGRALDLTHLEEAAVMIRDMCKNDEVIVVEKSTVPVKCAERLDDILNDPKSSHTKFYVISNPEFLSEGNAVIDLIHPDRVIIGGMKSDGGQKAVEIIKKMYLHWVPESKIITTDLWSAEITKLVANAFLAQRVSSINSISALCELTGANILDVSYGVGLDVRIGSRFLKPSLGFGGSCFEKDILCLVYMCENLGLNEIANYWHSVLEINNYQRRRFVDSIRTTFKETLCDKCMGIFGITFKANTSDTRESSAWFVIKELLNQNVQLKVYDPFADQSVIESSIQIMAKNFQGFSDDGNQTPKIDICSDPYKAANSCDALIICTEWNCFETLDYSRIFDYMKKPAYIFDGRLILDREKLKEIGFVVKTLGIS